MFDGPTSSSSPVELIRGLAVLAEPPTEEHAGLAGALGLGGAPSAADYSDLFLFQLYPYASVHVGPEGMLGGEARARVAGFWRALGYEPPAEPDHLAALLGLYATLAEAASRGEEGREGRGTSAAEARLLGESRRALLHEHLAPWVFAFLDRVGELAPGSYGAWAGLLRDVLRGELEAADGEADAALPVHLRDAPPLPDPREAGAGDFIAGLLAPVRSGVLFTRADLARIASDADLGLRAGERRYALEHLLAQDPGVVLNALAAEARRQGAFHAARASWLGAVARFHAGRAETAAELLDALAAEDAALEGEAR